MAWAPGALLKVPTTKPLQQLRDRAIVPIHPSAWRNCPKRVGGACSVASKSTATVLFDPFWPPRPSKFTLRVVLAPLFGQFRNRNSQKFAPD